jgi:hypothetical protein
LPSASKKRRFKVTEANSQGITVIPVDRRLEGAYTVTIAGRVPTDFGRRRNRQHTYAVDLYCDSEAITINGMQVVPEFSMALPLFAVAKLAATIVILLHEPVFLMVVWIVSRRSKK